MGRHDFDVADYAAHLSKWLTAQHGKLARHLAADGKFVDEVVGLVSVVDAESGDVVAVAPASKKEGLKGRCEYPVLRDTLAGMDLSGAIVSTDALSCQDDTAHTVLANGVAIPHGYLEEVKSPIAAIGIHPHGVDCSSIDGLPTRIFILLLNHIGSRDHIRFLAAVNRRLIIPEVREGLLLAQTREEAFRLLAGL